MTYDDNINISGGEGIKGDKGPAGPPGVPCRNGVLNDQARSDLKLGLDGGVSQHEWVAMYQDILIISNKLEELKILQTN